MNAYLVLLAAILAVFHPLLALAAVLAACGALLILTTRAAGGRVLSLPTEARMSDHPDDQIRQAARRATAEAPPFVPGSPQWNRLAAIFASVPDTPPEDSPACPASGPEAGHAGSGEAR